MSYILAGQGLFRWGSGVEWGPTFAGFRKRGRSPRGGRTSIKGQSVSLVMLAL